MKSRNIALLPLSLLILLILANGCSQPASPKADCLIDSASVCQQYNMTHNFEMKKDLENSLLKLFSFGNSDSLLAQDDGEPVLISEADGCLKEFESLMTLVGIKDDPSDAQRDGKGRLTRGISFKSNPLVKWLEDVQVNGADEIRICLGRYNNTFLDKHFTSGSVEYNRRKNRVSVFLYPYKNTKSGTEILSSIVGTEAYDLGGLHP